MTTQHNSTQVQSSPVASKHPLDPLTATEIESAIAILLAQRDLGERTRFESIALNEPAKELVLGFKEGDPIGREAFIVLFDNDTGALHEAIVSLDEGKLKSWQHIPGVQARYTLDEFSECELAVKESPDFRAAIKKRGLEDVDLVMVDPWPAGNFGIEEEKGARLVFARCWVRSSPADNGYARPIEGVIPVVDLNQMKVIRVEDYGVVPLPPNPGNYTAEFVKEFRTDLKPLDIVQPEGPSFRVEGNEVSWQKWNFRVGFTAREGLVLHTISYKDQGRQRPIIYRASLGEMVVPYGDPSTHNFRKNAFDVGEYGIGNLANSLTLGCDCLGQIYYFDAVLNDSRGAVMQIPNAVCLHEEDFGILWKHVDWRTGQTEVRRSRRLVVSFIATVANYEYGFFWYLYQDGTIEFQVKLTGVLNNTAVPPGEVPKYGTLVAPQVAAHIHQHFFNVRLDMSVDGLKNSVYEVNTKAEAEGPENPQRNAFFAESTLLATESEAQRTVDPMTGRYWLITNPSVRNYVGQPVAYKLMPGDNILPFAHPEASVSKRAGFIRKHLWVTPYSPDEMGAAGPYPNQHPGGAGLPEWTKANRNVENSDIVVWYTFGHHHVPRPEDWPVMPVMYTGFSLRPAGFFNQNPALDVPPSVHGNGHCHA
ncbi:MAG: primary-amine oxidase [Dehalococcoidia bacterium]